MLFAEEKIHRKINISPPPGDGELGLRPSDDGDPAREADVHQGIQHLPHHLFTRLTCVPGVHGGSSDRGVQLRRPAAHPELAFCDPQPQRTDPQISDRHAGGDLSFRHHCFVGGIKGCFNIVGVLMITFL